MANAKSLSFHNGKCETIFCIESSRSTFTYVQNEFKYPYKQMTVTYAAQHCESMMVHPAYGYYVHALNTYVMQFYKKGFFEFISICA